MAAEKEWTRLGGRNDLGAFGGVDIPVNNVDADAGYDPDR
jgi:hypothetical protein